MKETQLLKGVLEGCVLDMIGQKERYGYELVQTLREAGFYTIVPGTISVSYTHLTLPTILLV